MSEEMKPNIFNHSLLCLHGISFISQVIWTKMTYRTISGLVVLDGEMTAINTHTSSK